MSNRLDFNSPEFNKKNQRSFEVDAGSILTKIMKKVNINIVGGLAIYLILFGLITNIWLMFVQTKIYFLTALVLLVIFGIYKFIYKLKNKQTDPRRDAILKEFKKQQKKIKKNGKK